jgi:hypothetical protein
MLSGAKTLFQKSDFFHKKRKKDLLYLGSDSTRLLYYIKGVLNFVAPYHGISKKFCCIEPDAQ